MATEVANLYFWIPHPNVTGSRQLVESLDRGDSHDNIADLPLVALVKALRSTYPTGAWDLPSRTGEVDLPDQETAMDFSWSKRHLRVVAYGDAFDELDRLAKVLAQVGLVCFDLFGNRQYSLDDLPTFALPGPPSEEEMIIRMQEQFIKEDHQRLLRGVAKKDVDALLHKYDQGGGRQAAYEAAVRHVRTVREKMQ